MRTPLAWLTSTALLLMAGCSATSSSRVYERANAPPSTGPVFVSQLPPPADLSYKMIGEVKANARTGYGDANSLYPLLADEARKIGANAVFNAKGFHAPSAFSWAAPYVSGVAVKVDEPEKLKSPNGSFY